METKLTVADFEAFCALTGARTVRPVYNNSSKLVIEIRLTETVTMQLDCTALNGPYYGRNDGYTHVVVPTSDGHGFSNAIHFFGKGARGEERRQAALDVFALLA